MEQSSIDTPKPPYYAVVFSAQTTGQTEGYEEMAMRMVDLVPGRPGFLGIETADNPDGSSIAVSYWKDEESIIERKKNIEHNAAQRAGMQRFYQNYVVRVGKIERDYAFEKGA